MIRDDGKRSLLVDRHLAIQRPNREMPEHPAAVPFTVVRHDLLRRRAGA